VFTILADLLPLTSLSIADQIQQYGIWMYLLVFVVIMLASTIIGGSIPDNTFLIITGAVAVGNGLSMGFLFGAAVGGGFAGYEINYWSGRLFGLATCKGVCPIVLNDENVRKALELLDRFGPVSLILSRFMPVLNLPSFIAGLNAMEYRRYVGFNLISSVFWCGTLMMLGYYIGSITLISAYLDLLTDLFVVILAGTIILALAMVVRDYVRRKRTMSPE
jgi:membrane-associated protein